MNADTTPVTITEDKTVAILAYITLIGFIVAIVLHSSKKTSLGAFHLRQALGLILSAVVLAFIGVIPILGWLLAWVGSIFLLVLAIIGLFAAVNGQKKPVPVLGEYYVQWFGTAFD